MSSSAILELFHRTVATVPAYQDFLAAHQIDPTTIKTARDVSRVPLMSKKTYLQKYSLEQLCCNGQLTGLLEFCATSGSTSEPVYFPRTEQLAGQYAELFERYFAASSYGTAGPTLVIIGFGMGVWIGGVITLRALEIAAARSGLSLSVLPTSINKAEIMRGLVKLSPLYSQTLIIGYPPFVKDILDEAEQAGIDLSPLHIRLMFAAESFTESFRDYVVAKGAVGNPCLDTLNIYGSAEAGAMANETPLSILIRRLATRDPQLFQAIFGQVQKTPTLAQYNPAHITFEEVDGEVVLSAESVVPLVRYSIGDRGGVIGYQDMLGRLHDGGINLQHELAAAGIPQPADEHPFVFVYERSDFAVSLYGATLFPEIVKDGLIHPVVSPWLTERFTMLVRYTDDQQQYLEVNLETRPGVQLAPATKRQMADVLVKAMSGRSSEFREICQHLTAAKVVKFVYWPSEHPTYFKPGVKQRWAAKAEHSQPKPKK